MEFIEILAICMPCFFRNAKVLEIGSLDINGSIRPFFDQCEYIGIDISEGKCVDVVCQGQDYDAPNESFDHVISCEAMEHNPFWRQTFTNMIRLCRPGGIVSITCATTGRGEHGTNNSRPDYSPLTVNMGWQYYNNLTAKDFIKSLGLHDPFSHYRFWVNWLARDLYFVGIKSGSELTELYMKEWEILQNKVDATLMIYNSTLKSKIFKIMAYTTGDIGFNVARKIRDIHKSRRGLGR
jgi:SAM-dependent methyltransferase